MSFKDNLKKKITIDQVAGRVLASFRPPGSIQKVDLESMRTLLKMSAYQYNKERDLDLYYKDQMTQTPQIVVLDNELPLYRTTIEDVVLRKSPTVKEMISIRKAIRILNDKDVLVSKREETVQTVQKEGIDLLDLAFGEADLALIEKDGNIALHHNQPEGVLEGIELFAEILDYRRPPSGVFPDHLTVVGLRVETRDKKRIWGPLIIYNTECNKLKLIVDQFESTDRDKIDDLLQIADGFKTADLEGAAVFEFLKRSALKKERQTA